MTDNARTYPNISYVDTDTDKLVNKLILSYEYFTGRKLYRADPARLFILWIADIIIQERVNLDFSAKQNIPRYAEGEYLDSLAELFKDAFRLPAGYAKTTFRFKLSTVREAATTVAAGTRVTVDGTITFATAADLIIPPGEISGDVAAQCTTVGEIGNGFVPGQITQCQDVFPYFQSVANITKSEGGAEAESDEAFYQRIRESNETYSTAGPLGAYIYHAKTASALIADVFADSPTPGVVDVRVLLQGGELPETELLQAVEKKLSAATVRPLTDNVIVAAPDTAPYDIDFTYYMEDGGAFSAEAIAESVNAAVAEYTLWQSEKMGRDINPSRLNYLLMKTGIKRAEIRSPVFVEVADNAVAVVGTTGIGNGGFENE